MIPNIKLYYAHSKMIYGTQQEIDELEYIKWRFPKSEVICPHKILGELSNSKDYLHVVDLCSIVIVSEFNGYIGLGVFTEIARALGNNIAVFVLRRQVDEFYLQKATGIEILDQNDWKIQFGKVIVSKNS